MRGNKNKGRRRELTDEDDAAYEREYDDANPPPPRPSCPTGKIPIPTPGQAANIAKRMRNLYADPYLESYKCPACPWWHVGHHRGTQRLQYDLERAVAGVVVRSGDAMPAAARKSKIRS